MKAAIMNIKGYVKVKGLFIPKPKKTEALDRYLIPALKAEFSLSESDFYRSPLWIRDAALSLIFRSLPAVVLNNPLQLCSVKLCFGL